jgi:Zn-dependent peptidase ImmA (M78 family)
LKSNRIRAAYFCDESGCSALVKQSLPREPKRFALVHELNHHYVDRDAISRGGLRSGDYNAHEVIEKGAEVFAAEFIYPQREMHDRLESLEIKVGCTAEEICRLKRACSAQVSYKCPVKRLEWFGSCERGKFDKTHFVKVAEGLFGLPI